MNRRRVLLAGITASAIASPIPVRAARRTRLGLVLPLTSVQSAVANELLIGYQMAANHAQSLGQELELVVEDDRSEPARTAVAVRSFALARSITALSGIVGTPHAMASLPEARAAQLPVIGLRSGAASLRDGKPGVYHLRASYEAELTQMLRMVSFTMPAVSVVYSSDAFGKAALAHLQTISKGHGVEITQTIAADRNGADIERATERAVDRNGKSQVVILLMITRPALAGIAKARALGFLGPIFTMSFTAGGEMVSAGPQVVRGVALVSAFPLPRSGVDDLATAFRYEADALGRSELTSSLTAFEGFTYGTVVARAAAKATGGSRAELVAGLLAAQGARVGQRTLKFDSSLSGMEFLQFLYFDRDAILRT